MNRYLLFSLLILSLTIITGCSKTNSVYYTQRHTPPMNPGGAEFHSDQEFVKNYEKYVKNNTPRSTGTPATTLLPRNTASNSGEIEQNPFLNVTSIYELPGAKVLSFPEIAPQETSQIGNYNNLPSKANHLDNRFSGRKSKKSQKPSGGLLSFFKKRKPVLHKRPTQSLPLKDYPECEEDISIMEQDNYVEPPLRAPNNLLKNAQYEDEDCEEEFLENSEFANPPQRKSVHARVARPPKPPEKLNLKVSPHLKRWRSASLNLPQIFV